MKAYRKFLEENLAELILGLEKKLVEAKKDQLALQDSKLPTLNVYLTSLWSDEGEYDIKFEGRTSLKNAIHQAEKMFMETNRRDDVQANYSVGAIFPNGTSILVPEELWKNYKLRK